MIEAALGWLSLKPENVKKTARTHPELASRTVSRQKRKQGRQSGASISERGRGRGWGGGGGVRVRVRAGNGSIRPCGPQTREWMEIYGPATAIRGRALSLLHQHYPLPPTPSRPTSPVVMLHVAARSAKRGFYLGRRSLCRSPHPAS